jgi:hypothetical protein
MNRELCLQRKNPANKKQPETMKIIATEKIPCIDSGRFGAFGKVCGLAAALALSIGTSQAVLPDPIVNLDAAGLTSGPDLASWTNTGTLGGTFDKFPGGTGPNVTNVNGKKAVQFVQLNGDGANRRTLVGTVPTPAGIAGASDWTISTVLYRVDGSVNSENAYMCWSGRDLGQYRAAQFCYRNNLAAVHWGADYGFNTVPASGQWVNVTTTYDGVTETVYVDGVVDTTRTWTLNLKSNTMMMLGGAYWDGNDSATPFVNRGEDQYWRFNGAIASLKVFDTALDETQVAELTAVTRYDITVTSGANGTISPGPGAVAIDEGASPEFTITPDLGYGIASVLVDGVSNPGAVSAGSYTFSNVTTTHTLSATFVTVPSQIVSGKVTDGTNPVAGATVYFKLSAPANVSPLFTATTNGSGNYSISLPPSASWHSTVGKPTYDFSADSTFTVAGTAVSRPDIVLTANPNWNVLFSLNTDSFSGIADGERILTWEGYPAYNTFNNGDPELGPTVQVIDGVKWEKNVRNIYNDSTPPIIHARQDGFAIGTLPNPIPTNGVSIVAVVKPEYKVLGGEPRGEIVDICYGTLFLATNRNNGEVIVCTKGYVQRNTGYFVPDGQKTILSLVVEPGGLVKLYANGVRKWSVESGSDYTTLEKLGNFDKITVGRNGYDDWSVFNGNLGDIKVFTTAIDDTARGTLEGSLATKFGITLPTLYTITTSATNGTINPAGPIVAEQGTDQTFNFGGTAGLVDVVTVDGVALPGSPSSYTFTNIQANHTLDVTFTVEPAPANDNFAAAIDLPGNSGIQTGTSNFATTFETGEPVIFTATNTVWFKWTATVDGDFTVGTTGSPNGSGGEWDAMLGIYTGTAFENLTQVVVQDTVLEEVVTLPVTAGTTYYIQAAGFENASTANVLITWSFVVPTPPNPYTDWASFYFTPGDPNGAMDMDPDNDGLNNLQEYAFDAIPNDGAASGHMRTSVEDDGGQNALMLTVAVIDGAVFTGDPSLSATAGGVVYTIEGGNNLSGFNQVVTEVTPARSAGMSDPFTGWSYRTFRLSGPISAQPAGFLRVRTAPAP